jgi:hypothetical protein
MSISSSSRSGGSLANGLFGSTGGFSLAFSSASGYPKGLLTEIALALA